MQKNVARPERTAGLDVAKGKASFEAVVRAHGAAQHGVVARVQLVADGIPVHVIDRRVRSGRLLLRHRGVYQAGPVLGRRGEEMAAVLACACACRVSHRSAARLHDLLRTGSAPIDVTVPLAIRRALPGVRVYRSGNLRPDEVTTVDGVPVTTPARTLLDLAGCAAFRDVEQACARAERLHLVTRADIRVMLERHPANPGAGVLRRLLDSDTPTAYTRSQAEEELLALIRAAKLPSPRLNAQACGYEVDVLWPPERVVVEVDGYAFHRSARSFAGDRRRDADLAAAGYTVLRFTWDDLTKRREATLTRIVQVLTRRAP
jgi:very-short-patch-repair endonuclease